MSSSHVFLRQQRFKFAEAHRDYQLYLTSEFPGQGLGEGRPLTLHDYPRLPRGDHEGVRGSPGFGCFGRFGVPGSDAQRQ